MQAAGKVCQTGQVYTGHVWEIRWVKVLVNKLSDVRQFHSHSAVHFQMFWQ